MASELIFVGLGLSGTDGMTVKAMNALRECDRIYAEFYTSVLIGTKPEDLEAAIGIGYARLWYKESPRTICEKCHEDKTKNYFGPTKAAISLIYTF